MRLEFTSDAIDDIDGIRRYITTVLKNRSAATRIVKMITASCRQLKEQPLMGMSVEARIEITSDLRYVVCENWLVFYRVVGDIVQIVNVLDGRTDYIRLLFTEQ